MVRRRGGLPEGRSDPSTEVAGKSPVSIRSKLVNIQWINTKRGKNLKSCRKSRRKVKRREGRFKRDQ